MDKREERHGNSQTWNHASTSGQPSLRPLDSSGLKPPSPLRAVPAATPSQSPPPLTRQQPPQGTPTSAQQAGVNPQASPYGTPNPAMPPLTRQQAPQGTPIPAAQQAGMNPQASPYGTPNPAMPPLTRQQPPQGTPIPAAQPYNRQSPQPQGIPAPMRQTDHRTQTPQTGTPVPAWQPSGYPQTPQAIPVPQGEQPMTRRVWTQTVSQQAPQASPRFVSTDTTPVAAFVPHSVPEPTLVRREPQPGNAHFAPADAAAQPAMGETTRRRRMQAHLDREPEAEENDNVVENRYPTPAFSQGAQDNATVVDVGKQPARQTGNEHGTGDTNNLQSAGVYTVPEATQRSSAIDRAPHSIQYEAPDALDDDSGRYEAITDTHMAEPMPVPTFGVPSTNGPKKHKKRRGLFVTLIVLMILGAVAFALYQSGLGAQLWHGVFPAATTGGSVPSIFGQSPAGDAQAGSTIAPATQVIAPELRSVKVDPASATAPAQLTFQIETNAATSAILLLTEANATLHTTAYGTPQGDGLLWQVVADMQTAYTGKVRVFLRDQAGSWSEGLITANVEVK